MIGRELSFPGGLKLFIETLLLPNYILLVCDFGRTSLEINLFE